MSQESINKQVRSMPKKLQTIIDKGKAITGFLICVNKPIIRYHKEIIDVVLLETCGFSGRLAYTCCILFFHPRAI